eukprot:TRINITY_DN3946_c0_g1_i2.p1 TRINITY_DN3946_c0_g1~~TRINITY_DN3946_c0_g1_i2.p1  ORF type:complete len:572 (+),score=141.39 TRINITY_DN3946_c0_g1_i2:56-1771(+)
MRPSIVLLTFSALLIFITASNATLDNKFNSIIDDVETSSFDSKVAKFYQELPRYNFHFRRVSSFWNPQSDDYYQSLGVIALPFALCICLSLVGALISICVKCLCLCVKDKKPIKYTQGQIRFTKAKLVIVSLFLTAAAVLMGVANYSFHDSFTKATNVFIQTEDNMNSDINGINTILGNLNDSVAAPIREQFQPYVEIANQTQADSVHYRNFAKQVEMYREWTVYGVAAAGFIICVVIFLSGCCTSRRTAFCNSSIILLWIPIMFTFVAVNVPAAVFVADMCPQIEEYLDNQTQPNQAEWINYYLECLNTTTNPLLAAGTQVQTSIATYNGYLQEAEAHNVTAAVDALEALIAELTTLENDLDSLGNCTSTQAAWSEIKFYVCKHVLDAFTFIIIACLFSALVFPFAVCFGFELHKRTRNMKYGYSSQTDHDDETSLLLNTTVEYDGKPAANSRRGSINNSGRRDSEVVHIDVVTLDEQPQTTPTGRSNLTFIRSTRASEAANANDTGAYRANNVSYGSNGSFNGNQGSGRLYPNANVAETNNAPYNPFVSDAPPSYPSVPFGQPRFPQPY